MWLKPRFCIVSGLVYALKVQDFCCGMQFMLKVYVEETNLVSCFELIRMCEYAQFFVLVVCQYIEKSVVCCHLLTLSNRLTNKSRYISRICVELQPELLHVKHMMW